MTPLEQIRKIEEDVRKVIGEKNDRIRKLQEECEHPLEWIVETPSDSSSLIIGGLPPLRCCRRCGYAEQGWGCGYYKLGRGIYSGLPQLSRPDFFKLVVKLYTQDDLSKVRFKGNAN